MNRMVHVCILNDLLVGENLELPEYHESPLLLVHLHPPLLLPLHLHTDLTGQTSPGLSGLQNLQFNFFLIFSLSCVGACAYLDPGPGGDCVLTVLQPSPAHPGYLAGDELLHREPATRVLTFYTLYGKNKNGRKESPEDSGIVPICTN